MSREVEMYHREGEFALLTDGEQVSITRWLDDDGDECGAFEGPVTAIAGPDSQGQWWTLDLSEFDPVTTQ